MRQQNIKLYQIKTDLENGKLPQRGLIKDYFDQEIASNKKVFQLHITPENSPDLEKLFFRLKTILNLTDKRIAFLKEKLPNKNPGNQLLSQII